MRRIHERGQAGRVRNTSFILLEGSSNQKLPILNGRRPKPMQAPVVRPLVKERKIIYPYSKSNSSRKNLAYVVKNEDKPYMHLKTSENKFAYVAAKEPRPTIGKETGGTPYWARMELGSNGIMNKMDDASLSRRKPYELLAVYYAIPNVLGANDPPRAVVFCLEGYDNQIGFSHSHR